MKRKISSKTLIYFSVLLNKDTGGFNKQVQNSELETTLSLVPLPIELTLLTFSETAWEGFGGSALGCLYLCSLPYSHSVKQHGKGLVDQHWVVCICAACPIHIRWNSMGRVWWISLPYSHSVKQHGKGLVDQHCVVCICAACPIHIQWNSMGRVWWISLLYSHSVKQHGKGLVDHLALFTFSETAWEGFGGSALCCLYLQLALFTFSETAWEGFGGSACPIHIQGNGMGRVWWISLPYSHSGKQHGKGLVDQHWLVGICAADSLAKLVFKHEIQFLMKIKHWCWKLA